jgi:cystathionine beta-synthase
MRALPSIREAIGRTPIVRLSRFAADLDCELFAKCEFMNPGGSIKDRIGFYMVEQAEHTGRLRPGGTIVEATAGNTGMGLAMAAARNGYRLIVVMTTKMSEEKVNLMRACGAEVVIVPYGVSPDSPDSFINRAREIARQTPGAWLANQFENHDNSDAHYFTTGPEVWEQTEGDFDVLVAGLGTGGTLAGVGRYLKERKPALQLVLADPEGSIHAELWRTRTKPKARPYYIEGIGGDFVPGIADLNLIDAAITVSDRDAISTALRLMQTEGIFAGGSSGCILAAARAFCTNAKGLKVLALLPDGGRSYLSTIFNPQWRETHGIELSEESLKKTGDLACTSSGTW